MPKTMTAEADRILDCFRVRGLHAGAFVHFTDFGDAIVWEGGFVRDEPVRRALVILMEQGHVREMPTGLELTEGGARQIYGESAEARCMGVPNRRQTAHQTNGTSRNTPRVYDRRTAGASCL
jgi:hypothetical protein